MNIILRYLPLQITYKKLGEEKTLFDFFDKFKIQNFGDVAIIIYQGYNKT